MRVNTSVVENVKKLADRARSLGMPIIHVHFVVEKGAAGMAALRGLVTALDPQGILNPGKLIGSHQSSVVNPPSEPE